MELNEIKKPAPVTPTWNVLKGLTGERLNKEPLSEEAAHALARQLQESDASVGLIIQSNRFTIQE